MVKSIVADGEVFQRNAQKMMEMLEKRVSL